MAAQPAQAGVEVAAGDLDQSVGVEQQGGTRRQRLGGVRPARGGVHRSAEDDTLPGLEVPRVAAGGEQERRRMAGAGPPQRPRAGVRMAFDPGEDERGQGDGGDRGHGVVEPVDDGAGRSDVVPGQ